MTTLNFPAVLASDNVRAFLRVIREGETSQDDDTAYRTIVGGGRFDSFADHPRVRVYIARLNVTSSAAGAYQFLERTWDDVKARYGLPDFAPYSQDCGAVGLIHDRKALDDVIAGRLEQAIAKCAPIWASLPGDVYGQGGITMQRARAVFLAYGGALYRPEAVVEPAPIEDRSQPARPEDVERINEERKPMAPTLLLGLLASLAEIFSPILRAKLTRVLDKQVGDPALSGQVADKVLDFAREAAAQALPGMAAPPPGVPGTPAPAAPATISPELAVGMVKANAELAAKVEAQVADYLDQIAPALDRIERLEAQAWEATEASMDRAAQRAKDDIWDMSRVLVFGALGLVAFLVLFIAGIAVIQTWRTGAPTTEVWAAVTGAVGTIFGIATMIYAYRYGTSRSSGAKDVVIAELSQRRV